MDEPVDSVMEICSVDKKTAEFALRTRNGDVKGAINFILRTPKLKLEELMKSKSIESGRPRNRPKTPQRFMSLSEYENLIQRICEVTGSTAKFARYALSINFNDVERTIAYIMDKDTTIPTSGSVSKKKKKGPLPSRPPPKKTSFPPRPKTPIFTKKKVEIEVRTPPPVSNNVEKRIKSRIKSRRTIELYKHYTKKHVDFCLQYHNGNFELATEMLETHTREEISKIIKKLPRKRTSKKRNPSSALKKLKLSQSSSTKKSSRKEEVDIEKKPNRPLPQRIKKRTQHILDTQSTRFSLNRYYDIRSRGNSSKSTENSTTTTTTNTPSSSFEHRSSSSLGSSITPTRTHRKKKKKSKVNKSSSLQFRKSFNNEQKNISSRFSSINISEGIPMKRSITPTGHIIHTTRIIKKKKKKKRKKRKKKKKKIKMSQEDFEELEKKRIQNIEKEKRRKENWRLNPELPIPNKEKLKMRLKKKRMMRNHYNKRNKKKKKKRRKKSEKKTESLLSSNIRKKKRRREVSEESATMTEESEESDVYTPRKQNEEELRIRSESDTDSTYKTEDYDSTATEIEDEELISIENNEISKRNYSPDKKEEQEEEELEYIEKKKKTSRSLSFDNHLINSSEEEEVVKEVIKDNKEQKDEKKEENEKKSNKKNNREVLMIGTSASRVRFYVVDLEDLDELVLMKIGEYLSLKELLDLSSTCWHLRNMITRSNLIWLRLIFPKLKERESFERYLLQTEEIIEPVSKNSQNHHHHPSSSNKSLPFSFPGSLENPILISKKRRKRRRRRRRNPLLRTNSTVTSITSTSSTTMSSLAWVDHYRRFVQDKKILTELKKERRKMTQLDTERSYFNLYSRLTCCFCFLVCLIFSIVSLSITTPFIGDNLIPLKNSHFWIFTLYPFVCLIPCCFFLCCCSVRASNFLPIFTAQIVKQKIHNYPDPIVISMSYFSWLWWIVFVSLIKLIFFRGFSIWSYLFIPAYILIMLNFLGMSGVPCRIMDDMFQIKYGICMTSVTLVMFGISNILLIVSLALLTMALDGFLPGYLWSLIFCLFYVWLMMLFLILLLNICYIYFKNLFCGFIRKGTNIVEGGAYCICNGCNLYYCCCVFLNLVIFLILLGIRLDLENGFDVKFSYFVVFTPFYLGWLYWYVLITIFCSGFVLCCCSGLYCCCCCSCCMYCLYGCWGFFFNLDD